MREPEVIDAEFRVVGEEKPPPLFRWRWRYLYFIAYFVFLAASVLWSPERP
jgi:hypothetical protein